MQELPIENVLPGMKCATRIRNSGGEIIIENGEILTKDMINKCESSGIYLIHVLGNPVPDAQLSYDATERLERVKHLFRNHQENIFMKTMESFLINHFNERI